MNSDYLITADELILLLDNPNVVIVDCSYDLSDPKLGYKHYIDGHIPGAWYAHLEDSLSKPNADNNKPYPLPTSQHFQDILQSLGITPHSNIVVYDNSSGIFAARFWWLALCYGHTNIRLLDGGIQAFEKQHPLSRGLLPATYTTYPLQKFNRLKYYSTKNLLLALEKEEITFLNVDSQQCQNQPRPLPEIEEQTINLPYDLHLDQEGKFLSPSEITRNFIDIIMLDKRIVFNSQHGLAAIHSFFALALTDLHGTAAIYLGNNS